MGNQVCGFTKNRKISFSWEQNINFSSNKKNFIIDDPLRAKNIAKIFFWLEYPEVAKFG